jgi:hypothetical protein
MLIPFLLSSCFICIWLESIIPRRELVTFVVLISSMPIIFSAGVQHFQFVSLDQVYIVNYLKFAVQKTHQPGRQSFKTTALSSIRYSH